jgi:hypothetical protein
VHMDGARASGHERDDRVLANEYVRRSPCARYRCGACPPDTQERMETDLLVASADEAVAASPLIAAT